MPRVPTCRLETYRPTATTVKFTVSTRAPINTWTKNAVHHFKIALRFLVAAFTIIVVCVAWLSSSANQYFGGGLSAWFSSNAPGTWAALNAERNLITYVVPAGLLLLWLLMKRGYTEESLLVLRGLGVQTNSSAPTYLTSASTRFIPTTSIQDIFIHEAFKGFEVRFYLAIVVKGEEDVVVVFPQLLPSLSIVEEVWRSARACLYEPPKT